MKVTWRLSLELLNCNENSGAQHQGRYDIIANNVDARPTSASVCTRKILESSIQA